MILFSITAVPQIEFKQLLIHNCCCFLLLNVPQLLKFSEQQVLLPKLYRVIAPNFSMLSNDCVLTNKQNWGFHHQNNWNLSPVKY